MRAGLPAMTLLGELYAQGLGVGRDDGKAVQWYKMAAAQNENRRLIADLVSEVRELRRVREREIHNQMLSYRDDIRNEGGEII